MKNIGSGIEPSHIHNHLLNIAIRINMQNAQMARQDNPAILLI